MTTTKPTHKCFILGWEVTAAVTCSMSSISGSYKTALASNSSRYVNHLPTYILGVIIIRDRFPFMVDMLQEACHQGGCWLLEELLQVKRTLTAQHTSVNQSAEAATLLHTRVSGKDVIFRRYAAARMHVYMYNAW